jgi:hypothetical protein
MAEKKVKVATSQASSEELAEGAEELKNKVDEAQEKGYYGPDPVIPNEEWSLESGPDSPSAEDVRLARAQEDVNRGLRR